VAARGRTGRDRVAPRPHGCGASACLGGRWRSTNVPAMYLLIDLDNDTVQLAEPDDTKRFHIAVAHQADPERTAALLAEHAGGRFVEDDDTHAWVSAGAVRELAAGRVGAAWAEHFDKMLKKSEEHGYYDPASEAIKGHVEWLATEEEEGGEDPD